MKRTIWLLLILFFLGCAHTYEQVGVGDSTLRQKLKQEDSVYIVVPADGKYGDFVYQGSGQTTAQVIKTAFLKHLNRVETSVDVEKFEEGLEKAKSQGFTCLVRPTILHWEDRATEWSGKPDKVEVKINVVDVGSGDILDSVVIKGKSRWATFGGDHPQDLLPEPINNYVSSLF